MKILGVDPGSRAAGWAVVDFAAAPRLIAAGVIRPPTALPFAERLAFLHRSLAEIARREEPQAAVVEKVFAGVNAQSLIALGEARGVLLLALSASGLAPAEITPAEIKRAVAGSGSAEKEQVRRMVTALLGKRLALDASDAAAAALAHGFVVARRGATRLPDALTAAARVVVRRPAG